VSNGNIWGTALLALFASLGAAAQKQHEPAVVLWDVRKIAQYSNLELIDLLSTKSLEKNAHAQGMYSLLPPDRRAVFRQLSLGAARKGHQAPPPTDCPWLWGVLSGRHPS
jgi:hypothetical protein